MSFDWIRMGVMVSGFGAMMLGATGCITSNNDCCEAPRETVQWFFIVEKSAAGTQKKCVLCDFSDDENEPEATSCWYTYPGEARDWVDVEECAAEVCSASPNTNDHVGGSAWDVIKDTVDDGYAECPAEEASEENVRRFETGGSEITITAG